MTESHSEPPNHLGTTFVNIKALLAALSAIVPKNAEKAKTLSSADILDEIKEIISKKEVAFKKAKFCSSAISPIDGAAVATTTNSVDPAVLGTSSDANVEDIKEYLSKIFKPVNADGYDTSSTFTSSSGNSYIAATLRSKHSTLHAFYTNPPPADYVPPDDEPGDICDIENETYCPDDDDDEDECELVRSMCSKSFKLAC